MPEEVVYLLCFDRHLAHARHYIGTCKAYRLPYRLKRHAQGTSGVRILQALHAQGIGFTLARVIPGGHTLERKLKRRHKAAGFCPRCHFRLHFISEDASDPFTMPVLPPLA